MPYELISADQILAYLSETPSSIRLQTAGLTCDQLDMRSMDREWSINDIVAHLRGCADLFGANPVVAIIQANHPAVHATDQLAWAKGAGYAGTPFTENLAAFLAQRSELVERLRSLSADEWLRPVTIRSGRAKKLVTLQREGNSLVRHELGHVQQIRKLARRVQSGR